MPPGRSATSSPAADTCQDRRTTTNATRKAETPRARLRKRPSDRGGRPPGGSAAPMPERGRKSTASRQRAARSRSARWRSTMPVTMGAEPQAERRRDGPRFRNGSRPVSAAGTGNRAYRRIFAAPCQLFWCGSQTHIGQFGLASPLGEGNLDAGSFGSGRLRYVPAGATSNQGIPSPLIAPPTFAGIAHPDSGLVARGWHAGRAGVDGRPARAVVEREPEPDRTLRRLGAAPLSDRTRSPGVLT
jgi:hypothetical protein